MRTLYSGIKNLKGFSGTFLLFTLVICAALLMTINYFTLKTTSSIRAYVAGESQYSKGQKDASRNLILYLAREEAGYYEQFLKHIQIPLGDGIARTTLEQEGEEEIVREGFIAGKNHPKDLDNMIWLFNNFEEVHFMAQAIQIWREADGLVGQLVATGQEVHGAILSGSLTDGQRDTYLRRINVISQKLTEKEFAFTAHLGHTARRISALLLAVNVIAILVIVGSSAILIATVIRALEVSRRELKVKNEGLKQSNRKLDSFIYAASHDLKSPINNLEGLLNILAIRLKSSDPEEKSLQSKMKTSIDNLKTTIANIEELLRLDRADLDDIEAVSFQQLLDQILNENEMSFLTDTIEIQTDFQVSHLTYSRLALKSIIYNLVSNAIKYQSPHRKLVLRLSTYLDEGHTVLEVADNGLGIDLEKYGDKLFGMFKRFHKHNTGSGLGLYGVKEIVERNNGRILVESEVEKGSTFRVLF